MAGRPTMSAADPGRGRLARLVPALDWLTHYRRAWLRGDVVAALTTWALVVPQAIAYAQIADLPPQAGLFAAFAGLLSYALLGSSRQLVVSPTSSTAAITAALVAPVAAGDVARFGALAAALAILVGLVLALLGLLHMGFVSRFISAGVQAGFMFGLGLTIIVGQLPKLLGIPKGDGDFFPQLVHLLTRLGDTNAWTAAIGLGSLAVLFAAKRLAPALPTALGVVVAGIAVVALFGLAGHGVEVIGRVQGAVPALAVPAVAWRDLLALLPGALAIAVIGYAESATVAESLADEHGYTVRPDRELVAIGGANVLAGLFQGFITGGGASQSAANDRAGAQTQLVSLLVSGLTVLTAVALLPLFRDLPQAVLGAIVIGAVAGFLNLPALRRIARLRRDSFVLAMVALAGVLILGVLGGLLLAVVISIVLLLNRESRPGSSVLGRLPGTGAWAAVDHEPDARTEPGLLVFRLDAPLLFLNAKLVRDRLRELLDAARPPVRIVLLDLQFTPDLDVESVNVLAALHADLAGRGVALWLGNVRVGAREVLRRSGLAAAIGEARLYRTLADAAPDVRAALDA
jgi:SulP family sulfate permease